VPDSPFIESLNVANNSFAEIAGEKFQVIRGGNTGEYDATSIDDLTTATNVTAGGLRGDNTVGIWVKRTIVNAAAITEGTVLRARNKNIRVIAVSDDGDNTLLLQCGSAGVKL